MKTNKKILCLPILAAIITIMVVSCGSMPNTKIYSLDIHYDVTRNELKPDIPIVIVIDSPRYLSQPFVAVRSNPYTLTILKYSKWQSPPVTMVAEELKKALYSIGFFKDIRISIITSRQSSYSLKANLTRFEQFDEGGTAYGILSLDTDLLSPDGENLYHNAYAKRIALAGSDEYTALAEGLSAALKEVMDEIRAATAKAIIEKESKK
ncbi:ABC-type transport auxiliary lipoprotein family protein [Candidatus Magnetominusculus dajiuhuensis]|uniref:ABC-type transport auxiliary lipoprotein family protein n=1 Tax=Candidatus Magnetominusculus dajiuhuensis TaxID=3137712 RepID=UPI003B4326B4